MMSCQNSLKIVRRSKIRHHRTSKVSHHDQRENDLVCRKSEQKRQKNHAVHTQDSSNWV